MSGDLPQVQAANNAKISGEPKHTFLIPSPVPTRRNRTYSASERAAQGEEYRGVVKEFCRQRGHGFVQNDDTKELIFVHISDIDGEYVPKEGDSVSYKLVPLPFNKSKKQAVHVQITHLVEGKSHETWSSPSPTSSPSRSPRT